MRAIKTRQLGHVTNPTGWLTSPPISRRCRSNCASGMSSSSGTKTRAGDLFPGRPRLGTFARRCHWVTKVPEDADMGELLDALNAVDARGAAPDEPKSTVDQAAEVFQRASRRVGDAVDAARQPDMPLDVLARLVRQAPLPSLAVAFVLGVIVARR
jgi:hypothetical protein